jgi:methyl-accepting chemotaxis protein WspA
MPRFNDISIRAKLYALVALSTLGLMAVAALSGWLLTTFRVNGPVYQRLVLRKDAVSEVAPSTLSIIEPYQIILEINAATEPSDVRRLSERYRQLAAVYRRRKAHWQDELFEGPVKRGMVQELFPPADEFLRLADEEFLPLVQKGDRKGASQVFADKLQPRYAEHRQAVDRVTAVAAEVTELEEKETASRMHSWEVAMLVISILITISVGLTGLVLARNIVGATATLTRRVNEMASGASDLTARVQIDSRDEIGQLAAGINGMIGKIHTIVQRVRESSIQLLSTASEIAATARQQEATVQGLGSSTSEIAAAVREISATSKELSGTMAEVNERANQAAVLATAGRSRLANMEATMQQLIESTASISSKLALIREKADSINVVVTTITKVADQTNLLSINAAIEAEKAGEYGRGFLVVAREIRRLADQTAVATLDIENMVRHMHDAVSGGVMQMDKFSEEVRSGVGRVAEINHQTGQIIEGVHGLSDRFQLVNEGMKNQAIGAEQINEAMATVTASIRQTATALEEFNRATSHLRNSVELLNQEITQFKT